MAFQHQHHQLIRDLIAEIRRLRADAESAAYAMDEMEYGYSQSLARANESARRAERASREAEQDAETARYNASRLADIGREIEKAQRYGQDYKVERLRREARMYE